MWPDRGSAGGGQRQLKPIRRKDFSKRVDRPGRWECRWVVGVEMREAGPTGIEKRQRQGELAGVGAVDGPDEPVVTGTAAQVDGEQWRAGGIEGKRDAEDGGK